MDPPEVVCFRVLSVGNVDTMTHRSWILGVEKWGDFSERWEVEAGLFVGGRGLQQTARLGGGKNIYVGGANILLLLVTDNLTCCKNGRLNVIAIHYSTICLE